ncbi:hypothetical protein D0T85_14555 [Bacteroides sp. 519]|nr:hypothetical protein [Bacteroides sp. 519]
MFLGRARGKVGDVVFSVSKGQQTARAYVSTVNDAKTEAQVAQRAKLGNVVAMYRALRKFMKKGFESKPANQSDYNAFVSANMKASQVYLDAEVTSSGGGVVAPYIISKGTLQPIEVQETASGLFVSDIALPAGFAITAATTITQLSAAIVKANGDWDYGDQLTIVRLDQYTNVDNGFPYISCRLYEFTVGADSRLFYSVFPETVKAENGLLQISDSEFIGGIAITQSRLENGKIRVSPASVLLSMSDSIYSQYAGDDARTTAVITRGYNEPVFLDPGASGKSSSSQPVNKPMTVATVTLGSTNLLTEDSNVDLDAGVKLTITGVNLDPGMIVFENSNGTVKTLSEVVSAPTTSTASRFEGIIDSNLSGVVKMTAGDKVVRTWTAPWIDPTA